MSVVLVIGVEVAVSKNEAIVHIVCVCVWAVCMWVIVSVWAGCVGV